MFLGLDEGGMWVKGFGSVNEDDSYNVVEYLRVKRGRGKMPKLKQRKPKRIWLKNKEDVMQG